MRSVTPTSCQCVEVIQRERRLRRPIADTAAPAPISRTPSPAAVPAPVFGAATGGAAPVTGAAGGFAVGAAVGSGTGVDAFAPLAEAPSPSTFSPAPSPTVSLTCATSAEPVPPLAAAWRRVIV